MWKWLLLSLAVLLAAACGRQEVSYPRRTPPAGFLEDTGNQAVGKAIFLQKCVSCHGTVAEGRIPLANRLHPEPADFSDPKYRRMDPAYLYWRIATGKQEEPYRSRGSVMPAWGYYYSGEKIWQMVAYCAPGRSPGKQGKDQRDSR